MKLIAVIFIFAVVLAEITEEDSVLVLNDENFNEAIKIHDILLVEFYAPWCGHCKKLAPDYAAAAKELRTMNPPVFIAKVDATTSPKLTKEHGIRGFPTMKFFKNGNSVEYDSGRTKDDIVNYVKRKSEPVAMTITTKQKLEAAINAERVSVVGFFENINSEAYKSWYDVMATLDDVKAVYIVVATVTKEMNVEMNSIIMYKTISSSLKFDGEMEDLKKWIVLHAFPLVIPFSQQYSRKLFSPDHGITAQLMFFAPEKNPGSSMTLLEKIATKYMGKLFIVHIPSENARLMDYFGFTVDMVPALAIANFATEGMKKYMFHQEITEENMTTFIEQFFEGILEPFLKSEEICEQDGAVYKLIGKTFDEIVYDPSKNVLVKFYAPWCGHCKEIAPIYVELAELFKEDKDIIIAEMDSTANEVEGINIRGFPTIKFFKAGGDGKTVMEYEGERKLEAMKEFIEKNHVKVERKIDEEL